MKLETQYMLLGLLQTKRYAYNKKTEVLTNFKGTALKPLRKRQRWVYRFSLGYGYRLEYPAHQVKYLLHYGIFNPLGKFYFLDEDSTNFKISNIKFKAPKGELSEDIKQEVYSRFAKGDWYKKISQEMNLNYDLVRNAIQKHFPYIDPQHYAKNKKFLDAMKKDTAHYAKKDKK